MTHIPARLRRLVVRRSAGRCEYCRLSQSGQEATFHIDHVIPVASEGQTIDENLALACVSCSLRKGARETAVDPETNDQVPVFNPRKDHWSEHFSWRGVHLIGLTSVGRATIAALDMNRTLIIAIREEEAVLGRLYDLKDSGSAKNGPSGPEPKN